LDGDQQPKIFGTVQSLPPQDQMTMLGGIQDITERKNSNGNLNRKPIPMRSPAVPAADIFWNAPNKKCCAPTATAAS